MLALLVLTTLVLSPSQATKELLQIPIDVANQIEVLTNGLSNCTEDAGRNLAKILSVGVGSIKNFLKTSAQSLASTLSYIPVIGPPLQELVNRVLGCITTKADVAGVIANAAVGCVTDQVGGTLNDTSQVLNAFGDLLTNVQTAADYLSKEDNVIPKLIKLIQDSFKNLIEIVFNFLKIPAALSTLIPSLTACPLKIVKHGGVSVVEKIAEFGVCLVTGK